MTHSDGWAVRGPEFLIPGALNMSMLTEPPIFSWLSLRETQTPSIPLVHAAVRTLRGIVAP